MRTLIITGNWKIGSTTRIIQGLITCESKCECSVLVSQTGPLSEWLNKKNVNYKVASIPLPSKLGFLRFLWQVREVASWVKKSKIDLIHCNEHDVYPFARFLANFLNLPIVCSVRFIIRREFAQWAFGGRGKCPDMLVWTSNFQKNACSNATEGIVPESRQKMIYLGLNPEQFALDLKKRSLQRAEWHVKEDEIAIGCAAQFEPRKKIEHFIEVIKRLRNKGYPVKGFCAGGAVPQFPNYAEQLRKAAADSNLGEALNFLGRVNPIEPFHHATDIALSTSELETFGNSVCEAMACGNPVVGYSGGSIREVIGDAGTVVENGDIEGLTDAVEKLVMSSVLRKSLGSSARQRVINEFDCHRVSTQYNMIYEDIINNHK